MLLYAFTVTILTGQKTLASELYDTFISFLLTLLMHQSYDKHAVISPVSIVTEKAYNNMTLPA